MGNREYLCRVSQSLWLTPTVLKIVFEADRKIHFEPGQFLSVVIPHRLSLNGAVNQASARKDLFRIYSFACPPEIAHQQGYELSIKMTQGPGPQFMSGLKVGDTFSVRAAYGDFVFESTENRNVCFVSIGTGIAPFRSMVLSENFREKFSGLALSVFGASCEKEILYPGEFETRDVETIYALTHASPDWKGFRGRVTDYFAGINANWAWQSTDFYLCGNGNMVTEMKRFLIHARAVHPRAIFSEVYFSAAPESLQAGSLAPGRPQSVATVSRLIQPPPFRHKKSDRKKAA